MASDHPYFEVKPMAVLASHDDKPWCGRLLQAVRNVGWRVSIALAIFLLIFSRYRLAPTFFGKPPADLWMTLGDHIAVAFAVSAIVIFAFEWGSEAKHTLDVAGTLANTLTEHIETVLRASSKDAIASAMRKLAGLRADRFSEQLRSFADSISGLSSSDWAAEGYLDFILWHHQEFARYAEALAHLSTSVAKDRNSKTEFRLVLHEATDAIDAILAGITKAMGPCGTYYAISDVFTWTKLTEFHRAQTEALGNGLKIRRIFIIGKKSDADVGAAAMRTRMYKHFDEAEGSGCKYQLKLISDQEFQVEADRILKQTEHFGIFKPIEDEKPPLIVQVLDAQLLSFRIAGAAEADPVLAAFNDLWLRLPPVTDRKPCEDDV